MYIEGLSNIVIDSFIKVLTENQRVTLALDGREVYRIKRGFGCGIKKVLHSHRYYLTALVGKPLEFEYSRRRWGSYEAVWAHT